MSEFRDQLESAFELLSQQEWCDLIDAAVEGARRGAAVGQRMRVLGGASDLLVKTVSQAATNAQELGKALLLVGRGKAVVRYHRGHAVAVMLDGYWVTGGNRVYSTWYGARMAIERGVK